jgi:hypothetical protein
MVMMMMMMMMVMVMVFFTTPQRKNLKRTTTNCNVPPAKTRKEHSNKLKCNNTHLPGPGAHPTDGRSSPVHIPAAPIQGTADRRNAEPRT